MTILISPDASWSYLVVAMDDFAPHHSDDTSTWDTGTSPFGTPGSTVAGYGPVVTPWYANTSIWLRRDFISPLRKLSITIPVEDTCDVWVNGVYIGASPPGGISESNTSPAPVFEVPASALNPDGLNDLAIRANDEVSGGGSDSTYVAVKVETIPLSTAPPCRLFPREDGLGVGGGRTFPVPRSQQRSGRRFGYY